MKTITIRRFDDMHVHFRLGQILKTVAPITARYCERAVVMPNTLPRPILNADDVIWYKDEIERAVENTEINHFEPLMTIKIRDDTTPARVEAAFRVGAVAGKVYPKGVTTNSDDGLEDFAGMKATFRKMEELGMLLLLHGEIDKPRLLQSQWESEFLPVLRQLSEDFPNLKIVLEHASSRVAVETVMQLPENVAATITAHHLFLTENDVIGSKIRPHNGCRPMPKGFDDLDALLEAATSGNPKFFLGSDTAPHLRKDKECPESACGVFSSPVLPALLVEIFEHHNALGKLEDFTSTFGAKFYGLLPNMRTVNLIKEPWRVRRDINCIVPFMAGQTLHWKLWDS